MTLPRASRLAVTRKPLVRKNTSTAIWPKVVPSHECNGSALDLPTDSAKLWLKSTAEAATNRIKLKLLSRPPT